MIKVCTLFKRKPGLSVEAYQSYWRGEHPSYVRRLPGLRRYTQNQPLIECFQNGTPVYDGIVELWFDNSQALKELAATKEYAELNRDEENFVDRSSIILVLTDELVIKDGPPPAASFKRIAFLKRRPELSPEEFQNAWHDAYGPLAARVPRVERYVQSHARLSGYRNGREPAWDGIDMSWFASPEAMQAGIAAMEYTLARKELARLISTDEPPTLLTWENRVVA